jgi:hypothetical protein
MAEAQVRVKERERLAALNGGRGVRPPVGAPRIRHGAVGHDVDGCDAVCEVEPMSYLPGVNRRRACLDF